MWNCKREKKWYVGRYMVRKGELCVYMWKI